MEIKVISGGEQATVKHWIEFLEGLPPYSEVSFMIDGKSVSASTLHSYRGDYSELALSYVVPGEGRQPSPVRVLLGEFRRAAGGGIYHGYKGGDYEMSPDTVVWLANSGEYPGHVVFAPITSETARVQTREEKTSSVLQPWLNELNFMQQSVMLTCIRGCDGLPKRHVSKFMLRWYRRCIMLSAFDKCALTDPHDPRGGNFTGPIPADVTLDGIAEEYLQSVDEVPHHFHMHLVHAAEILGYKHPVASIREWWRRFYLLGVRDCHMKPETEEEMDFRLGDRLEQWQTAGGERLLDRA